MTLLPDTEDDDAKAISSSINEDKATVLSVKIRAISVISGKVFGFLYFGSMDDDDKALIVFT